MGPPSDPIVKANVRIRPLERSDREAWVQLRSCLWPRHPLANLAREAERYLTGEGLWRFGIESIPFQVLVAEHLEQGVICFVEASLRPWADKRRTAPVGYLEGWYVAPRHRRQGIGGALVQTAEAWARGGGCREVASDAHVGNLTSRRAHTALGYEEVERLVHFRRPLGYGDARPTHPIARNAPLFLPRAFPHDGLSARIAKLSSSVADAVE